jgi:hypothetical protein
MAVHHIGSGLSLGRIGGEYKRVKIMTQYRHILKPSVTYFEGCGSLLLDTCGMASFLGVPTKVVQQLVHTDRIPLPVRLGFGKTMRWNVIELLKWMQAGCPRRTKWIEMNGKSGWYRQ